MGRYLKCAAIFESIAFEVDDMSLFQCLNLLSPSHDARRISLQLEVRVIYMKPLITDKRSRMKKILLIVHTCLSTTDHVFQNLETLG